MFRPEYYLQFGTLGLKIESGEFFIEYFGFIRIKIEI